MTLSLCCSLRCKSQPCRIGGSIPPAAIIVLLWEESLGRDGVCSRVGVRASAVKAGILSFRLCWPQRGLGSCRPADMHKACQFCLTSHKIKGAQACSMSQPASLLRSCISTACCLACRPAQQRLCPRKSQAAQSQPGCAWVRMLAGDDTPIKRVWPRQAGCYGKGGLPGRLGLSVQGRKAVHSCPHGAAGTQPRRNEAALWTHHGLE